MSATPEHGGLSERVWQFGDVIEHGSGFNRLMFIGGDRWVNQYGSVIQRPADSWVWDDPTLTLVLAARAAAPDALRERVEALAGLSAAATPGPWESSRAIAFEIRGNGHRNRVASSSGSQVESADAALIVAAVNLVRALLDDPAAAGRAKP